jgi:hypothetical protein
MHRRNRTYVITAIALLLVFVGSPALGQGTPEVTGVLSNFDVVNTGTSRYNNLELHLIGPIKPDCVEGSYPGWGGPPSIRTGTPRGPGITVVWRNANDPIEPGRREHFGLRLSCPSVFEARGFWSIDGRPVQEVPLPWQFWRLQGRLLWDVIRLSEEAEVAPVTVLREFVTLPKPLPLKGLNWKEAEQAVRRFGRQWQRFDRRPQKLSRGDNTVFELPLSRRDTAALVRYEVRLGSRVLSRFVNQAIVAWGGVSGCYPNLPTPQLEVTGAEEYTGSDGNAYTKYRLNVTNKSAYPDQLFAAAPDLPPCGLNTNSSRTWVDIHDDDGARLYGFCALSNADSLGNLWFARARGVPPPECVSATLTDRRCELTYKSNCAATEGIGPDCTQFEAPSLGATYNVGDSFVDSGTTILIKPFEWSSGTSTSSGHARIDDDGDAGSVGQEIWANNVNLSFVFPVRPNVLFLRFGEYGGNLNININGDFRNFANFAEIHMTTIGGVEVTVTNGFGSDMGTLTLKGEINAFAIGGQELVIDQVCVTAIPEVAATGVWIMPFGVGGTRLDKIKPTGLTDYTDSISHFHMTDAPFGGRLGFRMGKASVIPTADMYYYRFRYQHELETDWHDFKETVVVHYVKEVSGTPPVFPTFVLGPHDVDGKKLYRFQPHEAELPSLVPVGPGETVSWPSTGFIGDIYRGFLNTVGLGLTPGRYRIKLEVFDSTGGQVMPGPSTFQFVLPTGVAPDGTILTAVAGLGSIDAGGLVFSVHVDNRKSQAVIDEPTLGAAGAGDCGFLCYNSSDPPNLPPVLVGFHATHPDNHALFSFRIVRGPHTVNITRLLGEEVSAPAPGTPGVYLVPYSGDGHGNFSRPFSRGELLGTTCPEAAFSENLHVYAKATRGWHQRITDLDAHAVRAFALTPNCAPSP